MVIDTSVLVAIFKDEPEAQNFKTALERSTMTLLSAASYVEAVHVLVGDRRILNLDDFDRFLREMDIQIEPVTQEDAFFAREAFLRYGKGRNPAKLNFGDCFVYALARRLGEPLLFKGNDFSQTDLLLA